MRLLFLNSLYPPSSFGGAEKVVATLAEHFAGLGHDVAAAFVTQERQHPSVHERVQTFPFKHQNLLWIGDTANHGGIARKLNKLTTLFNVLTTHDFEDILDRFRPDIVHSHSMTELSPLMWASVKKRNIKLVHTLHDYDLLCIRGALFSDGKPCTKRHQLCKLFSAPKRHYHRAIDAVVSVSNGVLAIHLDAGLFAHLRPENRHVIPNPIRPAASPCANRARQPGDPIRFGFLGRLHADKGIGMLLEACRLLPPDGWQLLVAGQAPGGDNHFAAQAQGLPITFLGHVPAADFFSRIDHLVVPPIWREPFGLAVIEAYQANIPVIGAAIGGVADLVGAVNPMALFPPGDIVALAALMTQAIEERIAPRPLPAQPVRTLLESLHIDRIAAAHLAIYHKLTDRV